MSDDKEDIRSLRRWLRSQDPEEKAKRIEYSKSDKVKKRRSISSKKRRHASSAILGIIKKGDLKTEDGKIYALRRGRIIEMGDQNKYVIRATKRGVIHRLEFDKEEDLDDERYDINLKDSNTHNTIKKLAERLLIDGDDELTKSVARQNVSHQEIIPKEKLYWSKMSKEEKLQLLEKLNSDEE